MHELQAAWGSRGHDADLREAGGGHNNQEEDQPLMEGPSDIQGVEPDSDPKEVAAAVSDHGSSGSTEQSAKMHVFALREGDPH